MPYEGHLKVDPGFDHIKKRLSAIDVKMLSVYLISTALADPVFVFWFCVHSCWTRGLQPEPPEPPEALLSLHFDSLALRKNANHF